MSTQKTVKAPVKPYEKPRIAVCYPSQIDGQKKIVVMVPGKAVREVFGIQHESLSVIRDWCNRYGYSLDTSRLDKPVKPKYVPSDDSDSYSYR